MIESPVSFESGGRRLRGILHLPGPGGAPPAAGIVFLSGWSGSRIGPHRMFVKAAREFTEKGFCCLRFDFAGRGESDGDPASATIKSMTVDARNAVNFLLTGTPCSKVILLGMCSGGKVALAEASDDPRVEGLILWSGEAMGHLRSPATNAAKSASIIRIYLSKLLKASTWKKILTLSVNTGMAQKAVFGQKGPDDAEIRHESAVLNRLKTVPHGVIFIYGSSDAPTVLAADSYKRFFASSDIQCEFHAITGANHNFYSLEWERNVIELTGSWLSGLAGEHK